MICTLTDGFDAATVERIQARLDEVERDHGVRVLWAVESGSRAWGFPSPDSDYDCRFFYVRRHDDYLSPWRPRDVIETPLDDVLDVNGWDLIKAIRLAAALHWTRTLGSPVPPVNLSALLEEAPPAEDVIDAITALVRAKAVTRELGEGVVPEPIRRFVLHEFGLVAETGTQRLRPEIRDRASAAFTDLLRRFAPTYV
ncbi:DNA polymerase beta superfamily protein [Arachnia propionica]|uniref:nucleotidyltransferase domain-containing protein n=1 Tax=Arachnia propionica TaxID=1750 RepID=UPI0028E885B7|nr:nucleotidyltransferase domain-containing protein [Arachnia propionica]